MATPKSVVRERSVSIEKTGDSYTVTDNLADEALVQIQALVDQVQFPNGLAYDTGDVALLTVAEVDQLDSASEGVAWQNDGFADSIQEEGTIVSIAVAGADADDLITNSATNQYTATVTYASGVTEAFDETNSVAAGVVWVSSAPTIATIAGTGLATAHATNDGTTLISATLRGVSGTAPVLTVA